MKILIVDDEPLARMRLKSMLEHVHDEIPYTSEINCRSVKHITKDRLQIDVDIFIENGRQQRIMIGEKGRTLLKLRQQVTENLEHIFDKDIILFLHMNVRKTD